MTSGVLYCFDDQDVTQVAEFMKERQVRRLPVFSRNQHLLGIVSLGDLAIKSGDDELVGKALGGISERPREECSKPPGPEASLPTSHSGDLSTGGV
jgi:CBS-domain-containing membrane protein